VKAEGTEGESWDDVKENGEGPEKGRWRRGGYIIRQ